MRAPIKQVSAFYRTSSRRAVASPGFTWIVIFCLFKRLYTGVFCSYFFYGKAIHRCVKGPVARTWYFVLGRKLSVYDLTSSLNPAWPQLNSEPHGNKVKMITRRCMAKISVAQRSCLEVMHWRLSGLWKEEKIIKRVSRASKRAGSNDARPSPLCSEAGSPTLNSVCDTWVPKTD